MRYVNLNLDGLRADPRFAGVYSQFRARPLWVWKIASIAAALVIVVPIVVLSLAAVFTFAVTFLLLSVVHRTIDGLRSLFPGRGDSTCPAPDGRRNVRVIRTDP